MSPNPPMRNFVCFLFVFLAALPLQAQPLLRDAFRDLGRHTSWQKVAEIQVGFDTFHPQGSVKVDSFLFVSSVEVTAPARRYSSPVDGMDRSAGAGVGHLFKMDLQGNLLADIEIGEGNMYHPGGIDTDGDWLWVPVAEYRPDSRSVIYRINIVTFDVEEVLRVNDHIGGVIFDDEQGVLHGVSWGSRRLYRWRLDRSLRPAGEPRVRPNPSHYIDYQDCMYAGDGKAICTGLATYNDGQARLALGGFELLDLKLQLPVHLVPFPFWTARGQSMAQNPVTFELVGNTVRVYAMPEDNESRLYVFEANP